MPLPTEVIAALVGGGAGLVSSAGIELVRWAVGRRQRAKAIKVALYYEIFRHAIFEGQPSAGSEPNFILVGFSRASYDAYLGEIPDLFPAELVGEISNHYADVTAAASQQQRIEEDTFKAREVAAEVGRLQVSQTITHPVHPDEIRVVKAEGEQIAHRMSDMMEKNRIYLAVAMWQQERLLTALRKTFKHDPRQEPVDVLPKYQP